MMKTYEKPVVIENEDLAEGVFAASGDSGSSSDCWTVTCDSSQAYVDGVHVFRIDAYHSTSVVHISSNVTYTIKFNSVVTNAYAENSDFVCSYSGDTVVISRSQHANAYNSGDHVNFMFKVSAVDQATTTALTPIGVTYVCTHKTNVQGGID